jgi:hypothetical protein
MGNLINDVLEYENGEMDNQEELEFFAYLIRDGLCNSLQGFYGRTAWALIRGGVISEDGEIL